MRQRLLYLALAAGLGASCGGNGKPPASDDAGCPGPAFDGGPLSPALVAQGSALVSQYQCQQCHGTTMSGNDDGVQIPGTALMQYPPNLTSDPATGLGCWTDDQIANAILNSVDDEGQVICGPMPHFSALGLTQAEAAAIVAYLRSLPVFQNQPPSGGDCSCHVDSDCPPAETCLSGSCACENLPCAIPAAGVGDGGAGLDAGPTDAGPGGGEDGGPQGDGGREAPDAGRDGGLEDAGPADGGQELSLDAGSDAGAVDAGRPDGGAVDAGPLDAGAMDAGAGDGGATADGG